MLLLWPSFAGHGDRPGILPPQALHPMLRMSLGKPRVFLHCCLGSRVSPPHPKSSCHRSRCITGSVCRFTCLCQRNSTFLGIAVRYHAALHALLLRTGDRSHLRAMNSALCVCARYAFCFGFLFLMGRCAPRALDKGNHGGLMPSGWRGAGRASFHHPTHPTAPLGVFPQMNPPAQELLEMSRCSDHHLVPQMISSCNRACQELQVASSPGELVGAKDCGVSSQSFPPAFHSQLTGVNAL